MKKILGACVGSCVHVAGIINFLNIAKKNGYHTRFIGSACSAKTILEQIQHYKPDIVGISYRLSPESAYRVFREFKELVYERYKDDVEFLLGTTTPVYETIKDLDVFDTVFTGGESVKEIERYLKKEKEELEASIPPQRLVERISYKSPYPLIRHHFGRPTLKETVEGIEVISDSGLIDVVSIGPDQNTQEFFFHPEKMNPDQDGAGGVPLRSEEDFRRLYIATRRGNHPLMRCYSGTNDIVRLADILLRTINNAWCAVPLFWYNELDNRSQRDLVSSIAENQSVMRWHAERGVPVEVNESHHWSLRYSSDAIAVAAAYLAAYNAKKMGVGDYVSQYMFNTPPETSFKMDLAKMLAKVKLIEDLHDDSFKSIRETRTGLYSLPSDFDEGKGQLASSTMLQMQLGPQIVHVVAYCEPSYAAKPDDIISSIKIVNRAIENHINGSPDMKADNAVLVRRDELISDAKLIIDKIKALDVGKSFEDPLIEPEILAKAVNLGILDAPHLHGLEAAKGQDVTMFINGANISIDCNGRPLGEKARLDKIPLN